MAGAFEDSRGREWCALSEASKFFVHRHSLAARMAWSPSVSRQIFSPHNQIQYDSAADSSSFCPEEEEEPNLGFSSSLGGGGGRRSWLELMTAVRTWSAGTRSVRMRFSLLLVAMTTPAHGFCGGSCWRLCRLRRGCCCCRAHISSSCFDCRGTLAWKCTGNKN